MPFAQLKRFRLQQQLNPVCAAGQIRKKIASFSPGEKEQVRRKALQHPFFKRLIFYDYEKFNSGA
jgi:hypothetical protein